jgi:flagellar hook assembly protein FlgD
VYDWNGDKVRTIDAGSLAPGEQVVKWGGDAEDGTPLGNGVYLARVEANDGRRTVTETIKIAIWRD